MWIRAAALTVALAAPAVFACEQHQKAEASSKKAEAKIVTVAQVAEWQKAKAATAVDANGQETRAKFGVIPGAVLLSSSSQYDVSKELPAKKDAQLVFYCANTKCTASDAAAKRATEAGYTDVNVLRDGIAGWKGAGQPTQVPQS